MKATKPLNVAIGTTVFERGRSDNALDGIGTYTQRLFEGLISNGNIQARPFCFDAAPTPLPVALLMPAIIVAKHSGHFFYGSLSQPLSAQ